MTKLLFMEDSYLKQCEATVQKVTENGVVLDQTIFYPTGGGQPTDTGTINNHQVTQVKKVDGDIVHMIEGEYDLKEGDAVQCTVNWDRRYKLMRSHTAAHLLSAVLHKETGALITGNQKQEDKTRVDFNVSEIDKEQAAHFVAETNKLIEQGVDVKTYSLPRDEAFKIPSLVRLKNVLPKAIEKIRIVDIGGLDVQACGGTHVKNTSEIKPITFLELKNKGKENRRIYFSVSDD